MRVLAPALLALCLAACAATTATLSPDQCANDWRATGFADGAEGAPPSKLDAYREACARGGRALTVAEEDAWLDGWRDAAERYEAAPLREVVVVEERPYPRVYPTIGVGIGSGGVAVGGGLAFDYGAFGLGFYF